MLWQEYIMNDHCLEYDGLTIEEKLLVNEEMKEWFKKFDETIVPTFIFKLAEERIIERLKEKDGRRKHGNTNASARSISNQRNECVKKRRTH